MSIPTDLQDLAKRHGYFIEVRRTVKRRGWPQRSAKPFGLYFYDGGHVASFANLDGAERALRARAGL